MDERDLVDIILENIRPSNSASPKQGRKNEMASEKRSQSYKTGFFSKQKYIVSYTSLSRGRPFVSEYDLKEMLKVNPTEISIPKNAILSPLAQEIIAERSIRIRYV